MRILRCLKRSWPEPPNSATLTPNTGLVIAECIRERGEEALAVPAALVCHHGPFTWGRTAAEAVYHAVVLETTAEMALKTLLLRPEASLPDYILDKHYRRKHGPHAYYGQTREENA